MHLFHNFVTKIINNLFVFIMSLWVLNRLCKKIAPLSKIYYFIVLFFFFYFDIGFESYSEFKILEDFPV